MRVTEDAPRERIDRAGSPGAIYNSSDNWERPDQVQDDARYASQVAEYEEFRHYTLQSLTKLLNANKELTRDNKEFARANKELSQQVKAFEGSINEMKNQLKDLAKLLANKGPTERQLHFQSEPNSTEEQGDETSAPKRRRPIPVHGSAVAQRYTQRENPARGAARSKPLTEKEIPNDVLTYTGMNSKVSLQRWFMKIRMWQAILDWTERQTLQCMCLRVDGEAATYIERGDVIDNDTTPEELCEMFAKNFSNTATELSLSLTLDGINMTTNEDVSDYNARFLKTVAQVGDVDESRKLIAYVKGLKDSYRQILALARPTTLAGAMQALSLTSAFQQATNTSQTTSLPAAQPATTTASPSSPDVFQLLMTMTQSLNKMSGSLEQLKTNPNPRPFYPRPQGQGSSQGLQPKTPIAGTTNGTRPTSTSQSRPPYNPRVNAIIEEDTSQELIIEEEDNQGNA